MYYVDTPPPTPRYSIVMHLDTLARDSQYLAQVLALHIDTGFVQREGREGRTSENRWSGGVCIYDWF